ncbi:MAG: leucine-rich repeat domain-containing protein [Tidjanibacter sp.]|nr:leucine-rich repeat domain-containing protein [Tidjanibacter sp.]
MKKLLLIFATALTLVFFGCTDKGGDDVIEGALYSINGSIQKGPFVQGSNITIQPLNTNLKPIGKMYTTQTINDAGMFELDGINYKYVEIIATGYYFDEVEGEISAGPLTLRSIANLEEGVQTNVNLLTTLTYNRIKNLVTNEGKEIAEAQKQAEKELYTALGIPENSHPDVSCGSMNIANNGEGDGLLLAISVVLQRNRSVGALSELIAKMGSDFADDGLLDVSTMSKLTISAYADDLMEQVSNNLLNRYNDLGIEGVVPPFAGYIKFFQDFDGDGIIDPLPHAVLEFDDMRVDAAATAFNLPFLYVDMEACEISINTPEAKEWVTLTIDGDQCLVSVKANTTVSERCCEIIIKEREGDRLLTFTIIQEPSYKIEYTYNPTTSTGELWVDCGSNLTHSTYSNGEGALFYDSPIYYIGSVVGDITTISLPSTVVQIENGAFSNCPNLVEFRGPLASEDGMLLISNSVILAVIASVTECTIPDSVTSIGAGAFSNCTLLTSITLPDSVTSIGDEAFSGCTNLTNVTFEQTAPPVLGNDVFNGVENLVINIPEEAIMAYLCCNWPEEYKQKIVQLQNLSPDDIAPEHMITYTTSDGLKLEKFPNKSDVVIHSYNDGIGLIVYSSPVTEIGERAFENCSSLTSITIPDSVTTIGESVFGSCWSLTSITIPDSVTSIGNYAFGDCYLLRSITIPASVTSIGRGAFSGCSSLRSITIPASVTSIGREAFHGCSSLTSITIPASVTSIGREAFCKCTSLTSVYCKPTTPPSGGNDMFKDNAVGRKIYVPTESMNSYKAAAGWSDYASAIVGYNY